MEATIALRLPREASSVPFIRHLLDTALRSLGVIPPVRDDIRIILSEACSNVVRHAAPSSNYTVSASVDEERCTIKITDHGGGFDPDDVGEAPRTAEHGRGLQIMRALADDMRVTPVDHGSEVSVEKTLRFVEGAPARALHCPLGDR
ncbi:ATP-binding protein [Streptosporangium soli]|nr:ATP-binding protein [Streptosporangium sp. KLBMP 9127]